MTDVEKIAESYEGVFANCAIVAGVTSLLTNDSMKSAEL